MQKGLGSILLIVGLVTIIVLVIITTIVGRAYYLYYLGRQASLKIQREHPEIIINSQPTPYAIDETVDWKSFSNSQYKINFKYPANLNISGDTYDSNFLSVSLFGFKSNAKIYYFSFTAYPADYDNNHHVGISRGEIERAVKNTGVGQTYQDSQTKRKFINSMGLVINGVDFTILKIQTMSDVIVPGEEEKYTRSAVALFGDTLYNFQADDMTYFHKILATVKFTQ